MARPCSLGLGLFISKMILEKWTGRGLTQESGEDEESLGNPVTIWLTKQVRIWNYVKLLKDMKPQTQ